MKVEQISVFLENKAGRLAEITRTLSESHINIKALSLADTSDFGILRLILSDCEKAYKVLRDKGFTVGRNAVVAVQMPDTPGGLDSILQILREAGVNVEYMYAFAQWCKDSATLVCRFDDTDKAIEALIAKNIPLISQEELNKD